MIKLQNIVIRSKYRLGKCHYCTIIALTTVVTLLLSVCVCKLLTTCRKEVNKYYTNEKNAIQIIVIVQYNNCKS